MKIASVFVLYNPELEQTKKAINSIASQVDKTFVIDNGSDNITDISGYLSKIEGLTLIKLEENTGIAHAINVGVIKAIKDGCDFILTSDQDSIFSENYIDDFKKLVQGYGDYSKVAAFASSFFDEVSKTRSPAMIKKGFSYRNVFQNEQYCSVLGAISSGMFINASLFLAIGEMNEQLFIDWVDFEWCFRAVSKGYKIIKIKDLIFCHHLGTRYTKVLWKKTSIRNPQRYYYIVRNAYYISFHCYYLPFLFRTSLFFRGLKYIFGFTFIDAKHLKSFKMCVKGIKDGMTGRMGKEVYTA